VWTAGCAPSCSGEAIANTTSPTILYAIRLPDLMWLIDDLFSQPVLVFMLGGHHGWHGPLAITISVFGWFAAGAGLLRSPRSDRPAADVRRLFHQAVRARSNSRAAHSHGAGDRPMTGWTPQQRAA
jgi:hypothetical protein